MGKKIILILLMAISLWGCDFFRSPEKEGCRKIISLEKMTQILTDVYLMEGYLLEQQINNFGVRDSAANYIQTVLDKHEISYEVFQQAIDCYLLFPEDMEIIHEQVIDTLSIIMSEIQSDPFTIRTTPGSDQEADPEDQEFPLSDSLLIDSVGQVPQRPGLEESDTILPD